MSTVTLPGGETIWYKTTGSGAPLVQIHGSAFGHRNFEKMTPFAAKDFEVVDFDLPGFGESRGDPRPGSDDAGRELDRGNHEGESAHGELVLRCLVVELVHPDGEEATIGEGTGHERRGGRRDTGEVGEGDQDE